jgi:hypothetical protein
VQKEPEFKLACAELSRKYLRRKQLQHYLLTLTGQQWFVLEDSGVDRRKMDAAR